MSAKDGGPAFPTPGRSGMTLRDYFAAKAIRLAWTSECLSPTHSADGMPTYRGMAERAYLMADAMLAARGDA